MVVVKTTRLIQKTSIEFMNAFILGNQKERKINNKFMGVFAYATRSIGNIYEEVGTCE